MLINHNLMAMNAYRQLNITSNSKKKTTEKLSSGYKINRAADDAAGLAISEKMRKQIRGLNQGADNIQNGISLCNVVDGALNEIHDILHRENELIIKAANGTNAEVDLEAIQTEIDALDGEIDRIFCSTEFNTIKLFKGGELYSTNSNEENDFEIEWYDVGNSPHNTDTITYKALDRSSKIYQDLVTVNPPSTGKLTNVAGNIDIASDNSFLFIYDLQEDLFSNDLVLWGDVSDVNQYLVSHDVNSNSVVDKYVIPNRVEVTNAIVSDGKTYTLTFDIKNISDSINTAIVLEAWTGIKDYSSYGKYGYTTYEVVECPNLPPARTWPEGVNPFIAPILNPGESDRITIKTSEIELTKIPYIAERKGKKSETRYIDKNIMIQTNDVSDYSKQIPIKLYNLSSDRLKLKAGSDITVYDIEKTLENINNGIESVSELRSYYGAVTNRLECSYRNNLNTAENTTVAESQIRDTDMAKEMVKMSMQNILEQVGQSMLGQANQANQNVLSLLS